MRGAMVLWRLLVALAVLALPVMPPAAPAGVPPPDLADCVGHQPLAPEAADAAPGPGCCIAGQCPMLAALPPPPQFLGGPAPGLVEAAGADADPPGLSRGPPRPPPRLGA